MPRPTFPDAREPLPEPILDLAPNNALCEFCDNKHDNWPGDIGQLCQMCWEAECARIWAYRVTSRAFLVEPDLDGTGSYLVALL